MKYLPSWLYNALIFVDVYINKRTYLRQMQANGFLVHDGWSRWNIYTFYRSKDYNHA